MIKFIQRLYFSFVGFMRWLTLSKAQREKLNKVYAETPAKDIEKILVAVVLNEPAPQRQRRRQRWRQRCKQSLFTKKHTRGRAKGLQKVFYFEPVANKIYTRLISH